MNEAQREVKIVLDGKLNTLRSLAEMQGFEVNRVVPGQGAEMKMSDRPYF